MKKNLVEMAFILDRSGSMHNLTDDTINGYNSMIEKQKKEDGDAYVTTVLFDDQYEFLHDHVNIKDIQELTDKEYYARGMTALLDAIGRTINTIGNRLSNTPEDERPEKVVVVITTDGMENSSTEFSRSTIKDMIQHQQDKYNWKFIFLGANIDSVSEADSLGIDTRFARNYSATGFGAASVFQSVSNVMSIARDNRFDMEDCDYDCAMMDALDDIE